VNSARGVGDRSGTNLTAPRLGATIPHSRQIRAAVSIVGIRRPDPTKLNICRESRVRSASWFSDNPARARRCRMTAATASQTGSSEVRGNGCRLAIFIKCRFSDCP